MEIEKIDVTIRCPECGMVQSAQVELTEPWATRIHDCEKCCYVICESEWDEIKKEKI